MCLAAHGYPHITWKWLDLVEEGTDSLIPSSKSAPDSITEILNRKKKKKKVIQ